MQEVQIATMQKNVDWRTRIYEDEYEKNIEEEMRFGVERRETTNTFLQMEDDMTAYR